MHMEMVAVIGLLEMTLVEPCWRCLVDDVALGDGFEPLHFMVEPMVQVMHMFIA